MEKSMSDKNHSSYIRPLFWQHGEEEGILKDEIRKMHDNGIGGFIVEARPHPDYLGQGWWRDLRVILQEAKRLGMEMWIFDDSAYPSGYGGGRLKELYPEALKTYMREHHIDALGPMPGAAVNIGYWIDKADGESLLRVIMGKRRDGSNSLDDSTLADLTDQVRDGFLYLDIPEGDWRIFIIKKTRKGGEEWTKDYVNPISKDAVDKYIEVIYEEHYRQLGVEFGRTIKGFFVDEPRFGNSAGYEELMGRADASWPYCEGLFEELAEEFHKDFSCYLPFLWSRENPICRDVHYAYMNVVTRLFGENFIGRIGSWCTEHGVKVIGHIVEDNGAHARLGYGPGHFFRSMKGFDTSGLDIVCQVWPERMEGRFQTPFGNLNAEFFYWGLCKMASSAAHIEEKKKGITACEIFGAYGWQEGLRLMKWLTDHVCVRGINLLIPHAFSPRFPDEDCPPHFYARGRNPQWRYFHIWSAYANRVCRLLSDGKHIADAAVLYHGEAEWGGACDPFEKVVRTLMENQVDCDVVPADCIVDEDWSKVCENKLIINREAYEVLIIPYAENIPARLAKRILELAKAGLPVVFMKELPRHIYYEEKSEGLNCLEACAGIRVLEYESLYGYMRERGFVDVIPEEPDKYLRCLHYRKNDQSIYFFTNESKNKTLRTRISVRETAELICYDAMEDISHSLQTERMGNRSSFRLCLSPYQSVFVMEKGERADEGEPIPEILCGDELFLSEGWSIRIDSGETGKEESPFAQRAVLCNERLRSIQSLVNLAQPQLLPDFSGTVVYESTFDTAATSSAAAVYLDLGEVYEISEVWLNGELIGARICPPHIYRLTGIIKKHNDLKIKVTNTYAKEKGHNLFDASMPQEPTGLMGPVRVIVTA